MSEAKYNYLYHTKLGWRWKQARATKLKRTIIYQLSVDLFNHHSDTRKDTKFTEHFK